MRFSRRDAGCARAFRGWRAEERKPMVPLPGRERRAPLGAPVATFVRRRAALSALGRCAQVGQRGHSARPNVSQLLEGSHSGPGGAPGRRTPSRFTTPHEAPLSGRRCRCRLIAAREAGKCLRPGARNPGQHGGGSFLTRIFLSRMEPAAAACVSLPRHETALFGSERCVWRELEGIGAPGADDRSDRSPECVEFMRVPVAAPLRVGATSNCPFASSGDRHRYGLAGRSAQQTSTLRIASEPGMALRTRAAIKPSLTLTRLVLPRCTEAP